MGINQLDFKPMFQLVTTSCNHITGLQKKGLIGNYFSYFSIKTHVVDTEKNHLNESSFEYPKHMFKLMGKNIITELYN